MARPLRLEYAGAVYHVTSRGDRQEDVYLDDDDRRIWLEVLATACHRFNWIVHAYCQMTNHYHLLLETVDGKLSRGMRQLKGAYTMAEIGPHFGVHYMTVSRAVRKFEGNEDV